MKVIEKIENNLEGILLEKSLVSQIREIETFSSYNRSRIYFYLKRHILISSSNKFVYVKTPKNACTKILEVLVNGLTNNSIVDYDTLHKIWYENIEKSSKPHHLFNHKINVEEFFKFSIVRNPYTRILSAWKNKILDSNPDNQRIYQSKFGVTQTELTFKKFIEILKRNKENNILTDLHFTNQYDTLLYNIISYDFIGKFENLETDLEFIISEIDLPDYLLKTLDKKVNNTTKHSLEAYYTPEIQSDVYNLFKIDFETFNYPKELPLL